MEKLLCKIVNKLFLSNLILILIVMIFGSAINSEYFSIGRMLFLIIFAFVILSVLNKISIIFISKNRNDSYFCVCLILFIGIAFVFYHYFAVYPTWDFGTLTEIAKKIIWEMQLNSNELSYLAVYPWNYTILFTYVFIFRIFGVGIFPLFLLGLSCILGSIIFIYYSLRILCRNESLFIYQTILFLIFPFLFYTVLAYTDVVALLFNSIIVYLLVRINYQFTLKNVLILSFVIALGSLFKITVFIFGIALMIVLGIRKKYKLLFLPLASLLIFRCVFFALVDFSNVSYISTKEAKTSILHYLYLGSNYDTHGQYSDEDAHYAYELTLESNEVRNKFYLGALMSRFEEMGFQKGSQLYLNKILDTWCDGFYFADIKLRRTPIYYDELNEFLLYGKGYGVLSNFTQIIQFILFFLLFYRTNKIRDIDSEIDIFKLVFIGVFIYLLIFETRSRYLFSFIPIFFSIGSNRCNIGIVERM